MCCNNPLTFIKLCWTPMAIVINTLFSYTSGQQHLKQSISHHQIIFGWNKTGLGQAQTVQRSCANLMVKSVSSSFFFFWLLWVFVAARGLSLVAASEGYSLLRCSGFSLRWLLLLWSTGSRRTGFSSCGSWA